MKTDTLLLFFHAIFFLSIAAAPSCEQKQNNTEPAEKKPQGYILKPDEGEPLPMIASIVKTSPETGSPNLTTIMSQMKPGIGTGLHLHRNTDEVFYIIEGTGMVVLGDSSYKIEAGDLIFIPKNTDHKVRKNDSTGVLKLLFFFDKPELLMNFREEHQQFYIEKKNHSLETLNKIAEKYGTYYKTMD